MNEATSDRAARAHHDGRRRGQRRGADPGRPGGEAALATPGESDAAEPRRKDPLAAVLALGNRASRVGAVFGLSLAVTTHGAASAQAVASASLREMRQMVAEMRAGIHDFLWASYEVDLTPPKAEEKPPEPPPPEPEPEPEPEPQPQQAPPPTNTPPPPPQDDPYDTPPPPPPAAAEATKVLTQESDPEEVVDLTNVIASGEGQGVGYGRVAGAGTAKTPTFNPHAKVGGTVRGTGTGAPAPPPPPAPAGPDRSRPARAIRANWKCPFPPEADVDQIDFARVTIAVTVRPDGTPLSVKVISDPGSGFGRAARMCALGQRFEPALDRAGNAITATTPPFVVRFDR